MPYLSFGMAVLALCLTQHDRSRKNLRDEFSHSVRFPIDSLRSDIHEVADEMHNFILALQNNEVEPDVNQLYRRFHTLRRSIDRHINQIAELEFTNTELWLDIDDGYADRCLAAFTSILDSPDIDVRILNAQNILKALDWLGNALNALSAKEMKNTVP